MRALVDAYQLLLLSSKPNCGLINDMQRDAKYTYKLENIGSQIDMSTHASIGHCNTCH